MSNGNKRYLGDVFINSENYEYQKQFFRDIIESYQDDRSDEEDGRIFNASQLQGKSASDFATAEQGMLAENALQSGIKLGKTLIANVNDTQYIYTDAINVDLDMIDQEIRDWYTSSSVDLTTLLNDIHNEINASKSEIRGVYDPFVTKVKKFMSEKTVNGREEVYLNATCVNGVSIVPISQSDYDSLSSAEKNNWKKVYIIRENVGSFESNIPDVPATEFRVNEDQIQINDGFNDTWRDILDINDLLGSVNFLSLVQSPGQTFLIDKNSMKDSISQIGSSEIDEREDSYPFLSSSLHDDFVQNILINNKTNYVSTQVDSNNKIKTVNLNIDSIINNKINPLSTSINSIENNLNIEKNALSQTQAEVDDIQTQMITMKRDSSQQGSRISQMSQQVSANQNNISQNITRLTNLDNDIGNWESFPINRLTYTDKSTGDTYYSRCILNRKLKLCYVYLSFEFYVNSKDFGNRIEGIRLSSVNGAITPIKIPVKPWSSSSMHPSSYNVWDNVRINDLGEVQMFSHRDKMPSKQPLHYLGSWVFLWDPAQDSSFTSSNSIGESPFE